MLDEKPIVRFDSKLLHYIRLGWDDMAQSMLSRGDNDDDDDLCNSSDNWGTLLHYAAVYGNATIARLLIDLGSDVDYMGRGCRTPLMVAIGRNRDATVKVLLEANADIEVVNADGKSALQMVFDARFLQPEILEAFYDRLKSDASNDREELVRRLIGADCSLYHAAFLGDLALIECMLERQIYVDSLGPLCRTALHAAAELNDLPLAEMLVKNGADVDAVDQNGTGALFIAAAKGNADILRLLLEHGADPNAQDILTGRTPLYAVFANSTDNAEETLDECAELLLRHGAQPQNSPGDSYTIFDFTVINESYNRLDLVISHLVMVGQSIDSVMQCNVVEHQTALANFTEYRDKCQWILGIGIVGRVTLFDLMTRSEHEMRIYARNLQLVPRLESVYAEHNMMEKFPYYCSIANERVYEARDLVILENAAIPTICDILRGNYNECYVVARKIVSYMNRGELERLCKV